MTKITTGEVLETINAIRKLTCPPVGEEITNREAVTNIVQADQKLLDLQERLLDDYGHDSKETPLRRKPLADITGVDTANKYLVGVRGEQIVVVMPPFEAMSKNEALMFAAWVVVLADDDDGRFEAMLALVRSL